MDARKLENLGRAVGSLERALASPITEDRDLAGIVKCFEMAFEIAWNVLKKVLEEQGQNTQGPRDVIRNAWRLGILTAGSEHVWIAMLQDRNLTVHTYDEKFAHEMVERIRNNYVIPLKEIRESIKPEP